MEWWCRLTLRVLALSFAAVGSCFLFLPDATIETMNAVGGRLGEFTPAPPSALRFWVSLATGYMVLVTVLAYVAQRDIGRHRNLVALLALGKGTTALVALGFYLGSADVFIYLANFIVDGGITLLALAIWAAIPSFGDPAMRDLAPSADRSVATSEVFAAVLEAMIPAGGPFAEGARDLPVAADVEAFVAGVGPQSPRFLEWGLRIFDLSALFLPPFRLRRFSKLTLDQRVAVLEAWEASRWIVRRQFIHVVKLLAMSHFYSRPEIAPRLGYPPPLLRVPRPEPAS
jgi:hypothetical protein